MLGVFSMKMKNQHIDDRNAFLPLKKSFLENFSCTTDEIVSNVVCSTFFPVNNLPSDKIEREKRKYEMQFEKYIQESCNHPIM